MVQVNIETAQTSRTNSFEATSTPNQIFRSLDITVQKHVVYVDGATLSSEDLDKTLESLGYGEGTTISFYIVQKDKNA